MLLIDDLVAHAALALQDVDRWVVPRRGHLSREHDVSVENRAGCIRDRLVEVVAVDEDGVDAGDRSSGAGAGALEQSGQCGEDRRRITLGRWRLTDSEADLAPGHR